MLKSFYGCSIIFKLIDHLVNKKVQLLLETGQNFQLKRIWGAKLFCMWFIFNFTPTLYLDPAWPISVSTLTCNIYSPGFYSFVLKQSLAVINVIFQGLKIHCVIRTERENEKYFDSMEPVQLGVCQLQLPCPQMPLTTLGTFYIFHQFHLTHQNNKNQHKTILQ